MKSLKHPYFPKTLSTLNSFTSKIVTITQTLLRVSRQQLNKRKIFPQQYVNSAVAQWKWNIPRSRWQIGAVSLSNRQRCLQFVGEAAKLVGGCKLSHFLYFMNCRHSRSRVTHLQLSWTTDIGFKWFRMLINSEKFCEKFSCFPMRSKWVIGLFIVWFLRGWITRYFTGLVSLGF